MPTIKYKKKTYAGGSMPVLEMTKAQYDALPAAKQNDGTIYLITDGTGGWEAEDSVYDNTESGLTATNVQDALDEVVTSTIEQVIPTTGAFPDESAVWMKFPNGVAMVWGVITIPASGYANSKGMQNIFTIIHSVFATATSDPSVTVSAMKSTSSPTNEITIGRRPITNQTDISYLVIGRWK